MTSESKSEKNGKAAGANGRTPERDPARGAALKAESFLAIVNAAKA